MAKRRFKGFDPAEKARIEAQTRRTPHMWGTNDEALRLPQNESVQTTQAESRTRTRRVERFDCFSTLKLSDHSFTAIRRYQTDLATYMGCGDRVPGVVVDANIPDAELKEFRHIIAANATRDVANRIGFDDTLLLHALSFPAIEGKQVNWKAEVRRLRGLIDRDAQAKAVRDMSEAVRLAYAEIDGQSVRRAA